MLRINLDPKDAFTWYISAALLSVGCGIAVAEGHIRIAGMEVTRGTAPALFHVTSGALALGVVGCAIWGIRVQRRNRVMAANARAAALSAVHSADVDEAVRAMREALKFSRGGR
jgi:hypothetical protein